MGLFLWGELAAAFHRVTRKAFLIKPSIVEGYPTFSSIPCEHRNTEFLTTWLRFNTESFDQIPEQLVTTEMRFIFCNANLGRLPRFESLPYDEFEALAILLYEKGSKAPTISPALLRESFLLKAVCSVAISYVTVQTQFHEHLFTQRVISRLVKKNFAWACHLHSGYAAYDDQCREKITQMVTDHDLLYQYGSERGKNLFHPEDIEYLVRMGRSHLVDQLVGVDQWLFFLDIPTSIDHCFWLMTLPKSNANEAFAYQAWLRQFPVDQVLAMANKKTSWRRSVLPVFDASLLKIYFQQYPWLKGHVLEDMLGL